MKHFTILELGQDNESPMIGTIDNIPNNAVGMQSFKERLVTALSDHFDTEVSIDSIRKIELFTGSAFEDYDIEIDDSDYAFRIIETWIY